MIFYFTGTGNSRFVAEKIAGKTGDEITDISKYIKAGENPVFDKKETYVFVAPSYCSFIAGPMADFAEKAVFPKGIKVYFVVTCVASMGATPAWAKKLSAKKGYEYMGSETVLMPQNYVAFFTTKEKSENAPVIEKALPKIDAIGDLIKSGSRLADKKNLPGELGFTLWQAKWFHDHMMKTKKFFTTDACVSCRKCVQVCPLGNISLENGRPKWGDNCTHCMACINLCPQQCIEYGKKTAGKPRYTGPYDIIK